jgi:GNAT superfamily N-acetyltransferase
MALNDIGTRNDKEAQPKASVGSKGTLPHGKQNEKVASTDKKHIEPGINVAATPVDGPSVKTKDENFATDTNTGEAVVEADVSDNDHGANHKSYEESGLMASATQGAHTTNGNYHGATGLEGAAHGQDGISVDGMDDKETLSSILDAAIDQGAHIDDDSVTAAHVHGTSSDDGITITTGDVPAYPVDASRDGETVSVSDAVEALTRDLIDLAANAAVSPSVAPPRSDNSTPKSGAKPKFESGLGPNFSGSANESKKKETEAKGRDKRKAKAKHPGNDKDDSTDFESEDSKGNFPKFYEESPFAREPEEPRKPLVTEALDPAPPAPVPMAKIQQITGDPMLPRKASSVSMATIKSEYIPPHSKLAKFVDRAGPDGKCELYNPYDEDEVFDSDVLHRANSKSWVMSWIIDNTKENTRHVVNLKNSLNQFCDINTFTGKYMEPVKFPVTLMGRPERDNGFLDDRVLWRQFNHTSNYRIRAVRDMISRREDIKKHIIKNHEDAIERAEAQADIDHANNKYNNPRIIPKESVYLRPTKIEDVIDVCKIFNLEVVDGIQAARFDEVKPSWFVRIFKAVANQKLPFIVAVECDEEVDINLVPDGQKKMYREFLAYREQQKTGTEKVLGFAYMQDMDADEWDTDYEYTGKPVTAKLHFYVHSDHRRHKIGHAMLNRMVSFVSSRVWRTPGYKWEESGDEGIYADSAQDNSACVGKLVMETHYPDPNDGTLTWHKKFFGHAGKFDMMPIDKTQSRRYGHQVRWENGLMARKACNKV